MKKRILSVLISGVLLFGTVFANAVSINFEELETDNVSIIYEELQSEEVITEESVRQDIVSPLATEIEEMAIEPDSYIQTYVSAPFDIALAANSEGYGSVSLDWSDYDYKDKNFKVYKSDDGGITYETIGIDYTLVDKVKCLQIYPIADAASQLKTWMEINGYSKGIIKIDSVSIDAFNANPDAYLKDSNGNYKYDVVFFGTWDNNNGKDLSDIAATSTIAYIKTGRGCIIGHDTIIHGSVHYKKNFCKLAPYLDITFNTSKDGGTNITPYVKIIKKGLMTNYPWEIGEIGTILNIPPSHTKDHYVPMKNIWLQFCDSNGTIVSNTGLGNNFYITTKNNCAMIQTGHSKGQATADEQKILANLIFYCNQLIFDTYHSKDSSAQDFANPNAPELNVLGSNFTWSATDNGSVYHYYVQSFDKNDTTETGLLDTSVTKSLTVTTGIRKYRYILDNNASTTVTLSNGTETTATSIPENRNYNYLHVAAIDGAGNLGPTATVEIPKIANVTVNHYKMNLDGSTYTLAETATETGTIGSNATPSVKTYTGFISPEVQTKTIVSGGITIDYYYTRNKYIVTYIDKTPDGKEIGRTTKQVFYDADVRGSDIGKSASDNAYYPQYRYVSDTTAKVTTNGATVYREFEFCETEKDSHLTWNDDNNADGLRPEKYTLKLKQNGVVIDEVELPSDQTDYTFDHLPKYDENGNPYQYEIETIVSDRYKAEYGEDGSLIFQDYKPAGFSVVIPKTIVLDGRTGNADYTVSINGTFYYNDILTVIPESSLTLTDRSKISSMQADVSQQKTDFTKEDGVASGTTTNGFIQINRTYFSGLWQGTFNFDIRFVMQN